MAVFIVVVVVNVVNIDTAVVVDIVLGIFLFSVALFVVVVVVDVVAFGKYSSSTVDYLVPSALWQFIDLLKFRHVV